MATKTDFSFQLLHEFFPERAKMLIEHLKEMNAKFKRLDDWRERQLRHFLVLLIDSAADLEHAHTEKKITTLAWIARNLLELSVWIQYCDLKPENAKRFEEDALQDAFGWAKAINGLHSYQEGTEDPALAGKITDLENFAVTKGVILDDDFMKVFDAAKEVGNDVMFSKSNKIYSKFAHPTAWVVAAAESKEADTDFRDMLFEDGANLAAEGIILIKNEIVGVFPELKASGIYP
jgi:hypothetical protein